jgi:ubiquitin carboxyl-terminal hydrolase 21
MSSSSYPKPKGLINTGSTCFFNSLLQCLLSCKELNNILLSRENIYIKDKNTVALNYIHIYRLYVNNPGPINPSILLNSIRRLSSSKTFKTGQQDSGECFHIFLDLINDSVIYDLFMYRYIVKIWCYECKSEISVKKDESCLLEMPNTLSGFMPIDGETEFNTHIRNNLSILDGYKCKHCESKKCFRTYQLTSTPKILVIMFNKFYIKKNINFDKYIKIPSISGNDFKYQLVSLINHHGSMRGGHYVSNSLRTFNNKIDYVNLNDSRVSIPGSITPNVNSYILFYNII